MNQARLDELKKSLDALRKFSHTMKALADATVSANENFAKAIDIVETELKSILSNGGEPSDEDADFIAHSWADIRALLAALRAADERERWQDISTAPKDGTRILLGFDYHGAYLFTASSGYWTDFNGGGWVRQCAFEPTHWKPLPAPPRAGERGNQPP